MISRNGHAGSDWHFPCFFVHLDSFLSWTAFLLRCLPRASTSLLCRIARQLHLPNQSQEQASTLVFSHQTPVLNHKRHRRLVTSTRSLPRRTAFSLFITASLPGFSSAQA